MGDKINREYFAPGAATFNYNNVTGGADSASGGSGGSGGSGMECMQLRSPPGPFHYLISEQAKSLVALQELQNEVGALLEFRDLVIETFPNLRSKMPPSTPASGTRRDWEPGVRVRRKLAGGGGDSARTKPQPSVQDSGFSTETSCGKDAHSSSASASASTSRSRPLEDELLALLDVIQRKGVRLRDEAELLRSGLDERHSGDTAEESFARALSASSSCTECVELQRLRCERDLLLARAAQLEAEAASSPTLRTPPPLGRLDAALSPARPPRHPTPDSNKFAAILLESNPVELQRQLLTSTVQNQVLCEKLRRAAAQRTVLMERLERVRDVNEDLKFRLAEKTIELEGTLAQMRQAQGRRRSASRESPSRNSPSRHSPVRQSPSRHSSMRDMEPLPLPDDDDEARISSTPRRRASRIPLHTAHKGAAPARPASAHSVRSAASARSSASARSHADARAGAGARKEPKSGVPVRRSPPHDTKKTRQAADSGEGHRDSMSRDAVSRDTVSREAVSRDAVSRDTVSRDAVSRDTVSRDAVSRDTVSRDAVSRDTVSRDAVSRDTVSRDAVSRDTVSRDAVSRDTVSRDAVSRDTVSRDAVSRDTVSRDAVSREAVNRAALAEYVARASRLAPLFPRLHTVRTRPLPADLTLQYRLAYDSPQNLALELSNSILYENEDIKTVASSPDSRADSLWNGKPQQYFESMNYGDHADLDLNSKDYDSDSLAP